MAGQVRPYRTIYFQAMLSAMAWRSSLGRSTRDGHLRVVVMVSYPYGSSRTVLEGQCGALSAAGDVYM